MLRNLGIRFSRHDLLAFIDSDCFPEAGWLRQMVSTKMELGTRLVMGKTYSANRESSVWASIAADRYGTWFESTQRDRYLSRLDTKNLLVEKQLLLDLGMFDENLDSKEDRDLGYRLEKAGERIGFASTAALKHCDPETLGEVYHRAVWYSRGMGQFRGKYGRGLRPRKGDLIFYKRYVGESMWAAIALIWFFALVVLSVLGVLSGTPLLVSFLFGLVIAGAAFRSLAKSTFKFLLRRSTFNELVFDLVSDIGHKIGYINSNFSSPRGKKGKRQERLSRESGS
jgi:cellulose synthase/poly-beta-1,6-N-acetylglucosamine synthase-like glycosyltransferase